MNMFHPLIAFLALLTVSWLGAAEPEFRFETGPDAWRPRAASISVTHEDGPGAVRDSRGCLRVRGRLEQGWNYAISERRPMEPGKLYRLSAWLCVEKLGPETPAPFLKCEFVGSNGGTSAAQVHTNPYDTARFGEWQELIAEFQAPEDATACWLALEKGTQSLAEIDAKLDEIRIGRIARLTVIEQCRLNPFPAELQSVGGMHPRLYLDADRIAALREAIRTTHAPLWEEIRELADRAVRRGPPAYREDDGYSGAEQLWQREVGNAMPGLALAYVLSGEREYLDAAQSWAVASCGYKTWGLGRIDGMDLAAGHQLFGLAIVYDWCYADLDETTRRTIRETIVRRGGAMFDAAVMGKAWWQRSYLQNHLWVDACGLAVAGLAVFDEVEDAELWVGFALDKFRRTIEALGPDGASHEGVGYWEYGVEYLLKFMHLARQFLGADWYASPWWQNTARYPLYLALPRGAWTRGNSVVNIADCPRGHWYGPDYLLRALAREYRDPYAQWLAAEVDKADITSPGAAWLNLIWYDPSVAAQSPVDLPTMRHFDDMEIVSARSDWAGGESLVVLKCGPFIGHKAIEEFTYDPGGGHVHPDANHFVLFGAGEWLIRDDGYRAKWTRQHNTLLVDGRGQLGEGAKWFRGTEPLRLKSRPRIVRAESTPRFDHMVGDATAAYPASLGLRRFQRHLVFLKPDVLIVADDIATDRPRELELRFHPESPCEARDGAGFVFAGKKARLRMEPLTGQDANVEIGETPVEGRQNREDQTMLAVRLSRKTAQWRNAVAFSWATGEKPLKQVRLKSEDGAWAFTDGDRKVVLDWTTGRVDCPAGADAN